MAQLMEFQAAESQTGESSEDESQPGGGEVTVFYMDIQNFGKGFNEFHRKCQDTMKFVRSRPYEIRESSDGNVKVRYTPQSASDAGETQVSEEEFELVVLAVGIRPNLDSLELAESLMVPVDEQGFLGFKAALPLPQMQREGIFAVGACEGPKDIQSCMAQAEAVSAQILRNGK
jgi:heterodisulfide reductase subunit A